MKNLVDKVAVITGAGSGIGEGIARAAAAVGMRVVVSDINIEQVRRVAADIESEGQVAIAVQTDVSNLDSVKELYESTQRAFGSVHLLVNNAGVWVGANMAEADISDWQYLINVNLYGVINGLNVFLPKMIEQGEGHIVNTSSMGGLISGPPEGLYCTTKFAIVGLTESLLMEVADKGVGVSLLCPGLVNTHLIETAAALRPDHLQSGKTHNVDAPAVAEGIDPLEVGRRVMDAVIDNEFYIITHNDYRDIIKMRTDGILDAIDKHAKKYQEA